MCMACEEADLYYRWQMLEQIAKGVMPPGLTEDDLRAMEMPVPGEVELFEKPDGTQIIRRVVVPESTTAPKAEPTAKAKSAAKAKAKKATAKNSAKANAFVCDAPEEA